MAAGDNLNRTGCGQQYARGFGIARHAGLPRTSAHSGGTLAKQAGARHRSAHGALRGSATLQGAAYLCALALSFPAAVAAALALRHRVGTLQSTDGSETLSITVSISRALSGSS